MKLRIPGMVDPHVHLRGMDWSAKGTFASETAAALAGGYWAVLDMPNTPPATITRQALDRKLAGIGREAVCDWGVYFGGSQAGSDGEFPAVMDDVCGLKLYNNETTGDLYIPDQPTRERHYRAWLPARPIAVHAEGETVRDLLALVRKYRKPTHFCHISLREEIDMLREAKEEGLPVTVGVTPHHLFLTEDDVKTLGSLGLMKPTLKSRADCDVLWDGIASGVVDVVESDHAPHTLDEKVAANPSYGVPGLETTLPLLCLAVKRGMLTVDRLVELVCANPQRIFHLSPPDNTYTTVDLNETFEIKRENLRTACGWSPFEGWQVNGRVAEVWIRGQRVFDGEAICISQGFGRNVIRARGAT